MYDISPQSIFTLITVALSLGIQYGVYLSFKTKTELELKKFEERMTLLELKAQQSDLKLQQVLDEVKHINVNFDRIFKKLDGYDENIKNFYRDYQLRPKN